MVLNKLFSFLLLFSYQCCIKEKFKKMNMNNPYRCLVTLNIKRFSFAFSHDKNVRTCFWDIRMFYSWNLYSSLYLNPFLSTPFQLYSLCLFIWTIKSGFISSQTINPFIIWHYRINSFLYHDRVGINIKDKSDERHKKNLISDFSRNFSDLCGKHPEWFWSKGMHQKV